jgi:hypothetical protein
MPQSQLGFHNRKKGSHDDPGYEIQVKDGNQKRKRQKGERKAGGSILAGAHFLKPGR